MQLREIARLRLISQRLYDNPLENPTALVTWMGAVQAQDYPGALWAVGQRSEQGLDVDVELALSERRLVRTWPLRGTLHIVAAEDVRWITALCAPRILAAAAPRLLREFELDEKEFGRARDALTAALEGGRQLQRDDLFRALIAAGIITAGQRGYHILWQLSQEGLLCLGPRRGKPQTFVLLDEWIPGGKNLMRAEALAELAGRYFRSHGPATLKDFAWWAGLTVNDAQAGLEANRKVLERVEALGQTYWLAPPDATSASSAAVLLPAYDEYIVAYREQDVIFDAVRASRPEAAHEVFKAIIVIDGIARGTWRRTMRRGELSIGISPFSPFSSTEQEAVATAVERYAAHLSLNQVEQDD